ncbi:MAG: beta-glucosidase BglX [Planctomycetota bacterium]
MNTRRLATVLIVLVVGSVSPFAIAQTTGPSYDAPAATAPAVVAPQPADTQEAPPLRFDLIAGDLDQRIDRLIDQMTTAEKIGQLTQIYPSDDQLTEETAQRIRAGLIGSVFYPGKRSVAEEAQRIAREESRLGIPLLIARDVIHGLRTVFPIPLGQAATWNPALVEEGARIAADEAKSERIDWTFAPMVDISRDARWGRIAETLGEDPLLAGELAAAMVRGFQQEQNGQITGVLACAKHFVGYGFAEGGRDYNRVSISQADLHNVALPPFKATVDAGCRTFMTTFSEVNGLPGTAHTPLLRDVLKRDWGFSGFVVSDWGSITEMVAHGFASDTADAAALSIQAGVDMDMCTLAYEKHLAELIDAGQLSTERLDDAVRRVLRCKVELASRSPQPVGMLLRPASLEAARETVRQSVVLLKNDNILPLDETKLKQVAVIGPMADAPVQQLGCWSLDGKAEDSVTPLAALRDRLDGVAEVMYAPGAKNTFDEDASVIEKAAEVASQADVALLFVGEDATLSGEARCRVSLDMPGVQAELIEAVAETGTPTVLVFLAGRPMSIGDQVEQSEAVMFAWHPGTMAGPAIADLLFGDASPSGKLPVTFPRSVGQTPIYYAHPNTGRPSPDNYRPLVGSGEDDLPGEFQYRSHYLDEELGPQFPFGFGLSYTSFDYSSGSVSRQTIEPNDTITLSAKVTNTGTVDADEVVQLYVRDKVARSVRPVRELKGFQRIRLPAGQSKEVEFTLSTKDLAYRDNEGNLVVEPGEFTAGIGGDSTVELDMKFTLEEALTTAAPSASQPRIPTATTGDQAVR